jgi:hypothetical protein
MGCGKQQAGKDTSELKIYLGPQGQGRLHLNSFLPFAIHISGNWAWEDKPREEHDGSQFCSRRSYMKESDKDEEGNG